MTCAALLCLFSDDIAMAASPEEMTHQFERGIAVERATSRTLLIYVSAFKMVHGSSAHSRSRRISTLRFPFP